MDVPHNMTTPRMKLDDGEAVVRSFSGLRKKGVFGNRFGKLVITNKRVAFVKSIVKSGIISAGVNKLGVKPMLEWAPGEIEKIERAQFNKRVAGVRIHAGGKVEGIALAPEKIDEVLAALSPGQ